MRRARFARNALLAEPLLAALERAVVVARAVRGHGDLKHERRRNACPHVLHVFSMPLIEAAWRDGGNFSSHDAILTP